MERIKSFSEFLNESASQKRINEAITVEEYINMSKDAGDKDWVKIAQNLLKLIKLEGTAVYWITSEDDDKKFDSLEDSWKGGDNVTKQVYGHNEGPDGRGSALYFDNKTLVAKYEASGVTAYIVPVSVYDKL